VAADDPGTGPVKLTGPVFIHGTKKVPAGGKLDIELDDFYFDPTYLQAAPGQQVTLTLHNEGQATHTFTIDELGVDVTVYPGRSSKATLTVPADHAVQYHCSFHVSQGMQGALFTKKGQAVSSGSTATTGY
jgi:plastocyanin